MVVLKDLFKRVLYNICSVSVPCDVSNTISVKHKLFLSTSQKLDTRKDIEVLHASFC